MDNFHILFMVFLPLLTSVAAGKQVYTVYIGGDRVQNTVREIEETHLSYLLSVKGNEEDAKRSLIYSYKNIPAFAAILTGDEASKISELDDVASVIPSRTYSLQTTRSWDFTRLLERRDSNNLGEAESVIPSRAYSLQTTRSSAFMNSNNLGEEEEEEDHLLFVVDRTMYSMNKTRIPKKRNQQEK